MRRTGANNKVFCDKCVTMPTCLHGQCTAYLCLDGVGKHNAQKPARAYAVVVLGF